MPGISIGELRKAIQTSNARWSVNPGLTDETVVPRRSLGGNPQGLTLSKTLPKLDLKAILSAISTTNPFIIERRIANGFLPGTGIQIIGTPGAAAPVGMPSGGTGAAPTPSGGTRPAKLDWRNRFGWPWITTVQDQDPCESCWAFASTALVESMVRIEHAVWSKRSEGDVHDGIGKKCADGGNLSEALDFVKNKGLCDPDCYPYRTNNPPYAPTPDRSGRTVKISDYQYIGDIEQQKVWLDTVGPIATWFDVYDDFFAYHTGVYHKLNSPNNHEAGGHFMLVVGYDDTQQAWICKNSWGTSWGQGGYCLVGYGESGIDQYGKAALHNTNPDPWTKRRLHSGNMIESGNGGLHRNFEMLGTAQGAKIVHYWRDNAASGFPWHKATVFGNDAAACPTLTGTTYNRNFESIHLTTGGRLHHWFFDQAAGHWVDGGIFGPPDAAGLPGFLQGNYGAPGNFEVVVRTRDGKLNHWWRLNGAPWTWTDGGRFGANVAYSGASLLQNRKTRNLELVAVLTTGQMQFFWRDDAHGFVWHAADLFGSGIASPPCMIEGQFGAGDENHYGNYELCVAAGGQVQHWWRDNAGNTGWHHSATFGHNVQAVASLVEGSFGFNLEVIVLRTDGVLQHYWRDGGGWHEGVTIANTMAAVT